MEETNSCPGGLLREGDWTRGGDCASESHLVPTLQAAARFWYGGGPTSDSQLKPEARPRLQASETCDTCDSSCGVCPVLPKTPW